ISPAQTRKIAKVSDKQVARDVILQAVEAGELTIAAAVEQIGVTRNQVLKLLKQRRDCGPPPPMAAMAAKLDTPRGKRLYKQRSASVEPVFAQIKHNRKMRTFSRRGLAAVDHEWKLMAATHNLLKL